jgi:EAL domain-containing protein (putative c-di-GMP-specific phosphodiesterase class I)
MHSAGIKVLAEGVETEAEFLYLMHRDVDYMQGFYLGKPIIYGQR